MSSAAANAVRSTAAKPAVSRVLARRKLQKGPKGVKQFPEPINIWKVVRGDKVEITAGKEKGKRGTIKQVLRKEHRVIIEGMNLLKKHQKGQGPQNPGQIISVESPMHLSNVMLIDPVEDTPTRVRFGFLQDGTKVRIATKSGSIIPKPEILTTRRTPVPYGPPDKDTAPAEVTKKTLSDEEEVLQNAIRRLTILGHRQTLEEPVSPKP